MSKRFARKHRQIAKQPIIAATAPYRELVSEISSLLEQSRRIAARSVNAILTSAYWQIGQRIVEHEQGGKSRAEYGESLLVVLAQDLTDRYGRGFSKSNLFQMRAFFLGWEIFQTSSGIFEARAKFQTLSGISQIANMSAEQTEESVAYATQVGEAHGTEVQRIAGQSSILQTLSAKSDLVSTPGIFPLSWSHYTRLMSVDKPHARAFYEAEAIRGGWSVRQLDRQIGTQFFERTVHSRNPAALLARGQQARPEDLLSAQDQVRDPYVLEFLDLKDEYSETELEQALVSHLETFLLELGTSFTFVARQKRIRIGNEWYRMDLLLFHRRLRCLVVIDLKVGKFTHADAGQMNLYLNYLLAAHMTEPGESDPVGLVLCSAKDDAVVHYAMGGIKAKVFASHYLTALPDAETLRQEILATQRALESGAKMAKRRR